jgi:phosphate transport system permease protein
MMSMSADSRSQSLLSQRLRRNRLVLTSSVLITAFALFWLAWILLATFTRGFAALTPSLFLRNTPAPGDAGGLLNAFAGSLVMVGLGTLMGTPVGILAGIFLGEFGKGSKVASTVRFFNDILLSTPSIIVGLFIYALVVVPMGGFSGLAGSFTLAILLLPIVLRTTDEMLRLVPSQTREAALALGAPYWMVILKVTLRAASSGIVTGVLLAIARISGETAPLLFTALNNQFWSLNLGKPMANLPVVVFQFAMSPYQGWQQLAWAGALIAMLAVLLTGIFTRLIFAPRKP